ncbi:SusC/RagA family TonB-linked outer membrane protein [Subsaxibacter sp. CAU 1640]|uniref:SusC/RagA family TonB-linked outer membrane protein n=1 Tax=Subsaxibacter sp. CAU 1640 TaxID=2933271 RepID=UPI002002BA03|nr:SusC/RagA family TonB-linked outer membrane protein [Subsaxibacter sp. CAU 1640]MCK7589054.1 SusC/RagA family TonB-linked outer membrane protein [Subsaxibacter sp. CAU 1640]
MSQSTVSGTVTEEASTLPVPGVNVIIKGTSTGTTTDFDGKYSINVKTGDVLVFSYIGYKTQEITYNNQSTINISLAEDTAKLDEVVVIGYGTTTVKDATGSVEKIDSETFNKGAIVSPENLLAGKSAGVRITSSSGSPGSGAEIRIRNGGSLSGSNSPLIVVDGIPLSGQSINAINPNEIESYTILKDASATAIYGSRATAGVVIITTKKGRTNTPLQVEYDLQISTGKLIDKVDVLSADQFRQYIIDNGGNENLLGNAKTDWQDEIYEAAQGGIHNLTVSKGFKNSSIRVNYNLANQNGILLTSQYRRNAINLNYEHRLLDDHLKVNITSKGSFVDNRFADEGAIGSALFFDPTQPVEGNWAGYFEFEDEDGVRNLAPRNPVSLLLLRDNRQRAKRNISNIQLDYKFHFLPELRLNVNAGFDYEEYDGRYFTDPSAGFNNLNADQFASRGTYFGTNKNRLLDLYLNYKKDLNSIVSKVDVTAGHTYQRFYNIGESRDLNTATGEFDAVVPPSPFQLILESYFARAEITLAQKYIFTGTFRRDITSRFSPDNRNGNFPSAAFAWLASDEDFLKDLNTFSNLKLRLSWGVTGQQAIGGAFPYLGVYSLGDIQSQYQFGNQFVPTIRPEGYNEDLKWEEATMYNVGLDYGLFNNKITGTVDLYYRKNKDLLQYAPVPAGSNLENFLDQNVGETVSRGVEFGINFSPVKNDNFNWDVSANFTLSDVEITKLTLNDAPGSIGTPTGPTLSGGVGNLIQINTVGYEPNAFYVFKQVYGADGQPIEGAYMDLNGDNVINDSDKYRYQSPTPDAFFGFTSNMSYKNLDLSFTLRGSLGNYMYNNFKSANGYGQAILNQVGNQHYGNGSTDVLNTNFVNNQQFSDLYVENASFLRMDNISLGYNVPFEKIKFRASLTAQNVFTITEYSGLDPEIASGVDNNVYPKPRTFVLGLNFTF